MAKHRKKPVDKRATNLDVGEITTPRRGGRYDGTSVGRDKNGFFVTTHRARSKSYESPKDIPSGKIKFIKSTG